MVCMHKSLTSIQLSCLKAFDNLDGPKVLGQLLSFTETIMEAALWKHKWEGTLLPPLLSFMSQYIGLFYCLGILTQRVNMRALTPVQSSELAV